MTCPSCAAPRTTVDDACPWCGAPSALLEPPALALPPVAACEGLRCPAGHGDLALVRLPGPMSLSLGHCHHCQGVFLGRGGLDGLLLGLDPGLLQPAATASGWRPCPLCGATMARQGFAGRPGLIVDLCADHGMWLEAEEWAWLLAGDGADHELLRRLRTALTPLASP
jgi:Zn-finger nucleic acid-binding protein